MEKLLVLGMGQRIYIKSPENHAVLERKHLKNPHNDGCISKEKEEPNERDLNGQS